MEGDDLRLESLERRLHGLEGRISRLEAAVTPAVAAPAVPPTPPRPLAAPPAPPRAADQRWTASTWWTSPQPISPGLVPPDAQVGARSSHPSVPTAPHTPAEPPASVVSPKPAWAVVAPVTGPGWSLRDLEERFAGRALAWVGGLALVAAAVFFLSLAFSRGWINEPMRVLIGLTVGIAALAGGAVMLARRNRLMGNVLSAVGLGIISIALFAATRLYGLVNPEVGLACALAAATAAAAVAIRFDAKEVAAFGLIAALIAPPVVGASPTTLTLLFVGVTLIGTTAIALFRTWPYLPPLAFILAAPQLASWLMGDPVTAQALIALAGFWLINIVAAAGEEMRIRRDDLRPSSATLVLANATFLLWGGLVVLSGDLAVWRGTFIAVESIAHLVLGGWFLSRQGVEHLFGNLVAGTGVALLAIAAFVQVGAAVVPLAWAAESVALAWLAVRRRHRWSAAAAMVLAGLVITHLVIVEYPLRDFGLREAPFYSPPFRHPGAGSLAAVLVAIGVTAALVPVRWIRSALAGAGVLLATYAVTFELSGPFLVAALTGLALAGLLLDRLIERLAVDDGLAPLAQWVPGGWLASAASLVAGALAILVMFVTEYPVRGLGDVSGTPFLNPSGASLAVTLVGLVAASAIVGVRWIRSALAATGILLVAWAAGSEVAGTGLVGLLAVLLPVGVILDRTLRRLPEDERYSWLVPVLDFDPMAAAAGVVAWSAAIRLRCRALPRPRHLGFRHAACDSVQRRHGPRGSAARRCGACRRPVERERDRPPGGRGRRPGRRGPRRPVRGLRRLGGRALGRSRGRRVPVRATGPRGCQGVPDRWHRAPGPGPPSSPSGSWLRHTGCGWPIPSTTPDPPCCPGGRSRSPSSRAACSRRRGRPGSPAGGHGWRSGPGSSPCTSSRSLSLRSSRAASGARPTWRS